MRKFTSVTRTAPGNEEPTKTPTVCCVNTCRREPIFPATRNPNWTRSRCVSINAREKLWASRLQQVNCAQVLRRPSEPARLIRTWGDASCMSGFCEGGKHPTRGNTVGFVWYSRRGLRSRDAVSTVDGASVFCAVVATRGNQQPRQ